MNEASDLQKLVLKELEHALDKICCDQHNDGGSLTGNTQSSDLEWLAATLFESSTLGAGDVRTVNWLLSPEEREQLGISAASVWSGRRFDSLSEPEKEAWRKLARIVMYVLPAFAERVGHRYMLQAKAIRQVWNQVREQ